MSTSLLRTLFAQKAFANDAALTKLEGWADEHAKQHLSARQHLNHALLVDQVFKAHLAGEPHAISAVFVSDPPELPALKAAVQASDAWYANYVAGLSDEALEESVLFTFTDGQLGSMTRGEMLHHVLLHSTYHRGHAGQIVRSVGLSPSPDTLTSFLHMREPERRRG